MTHTPERRLSFQRRVVTEAYLGRLRLPERRATDELKRRLRKSAGINRQKA